MKKLIMPAFPEQLQPLTTKQKIYLYVKDHPASYQVQIAKAVGILDAKEPLNEMENASLLYHELCPCPQKTKLWFCKK